MIEGGSRFIQIREKNASSDEFYRSVVECLEIAKPTGTTIIVNDRVDIALAALSHGVHLGQTDLPLAEARKLLGEEAIIGISTHSVEQARRAFEMPVNYIAFGPIWPTSSKANPDPVVGLDLLRDVKSVVGDLPLVAIGGISDSNLNATLSAGADSAAIISDLYRSTEPVAARYRALADIAGV